MLGTIYRKSMNHSSDFFWGSVENPECNGWAYVGRGEGDTQVCKMYTCATPEMQIGVFFLLLFFFLQWMQITKSQLGVKTFQVKGVFFKQSFCSFPSIKNPA